MRTTKSHNQATRATVTPASSTGRQCGGGWFALPFPVGLCSTTLTMTRMDAARGHGLDCLNIGLSKLSSPNQDGFIAPPTMNASPEPQSPAAPTQCLPAPNKSKPGSQTPAPTLLRRRRLRYGTCSAVRCAQVRVSGCRQGLDAASHDESPE